MKTSDVRIGQSKSKVSGCRTRATARLCMRLWALLLPMFLVVACMRPESRTNADLERARKANESNASWLADELVAKAEISATDSAFGVPQKKLYSFTLCVRDRRTTDAIRGQDFTITGLLGEEQKKTSNQQGCLIWSEDIAYNFFADPAYVPASIQVRADGAHSGTRTLEVALNPWSQTESLIDLSRRTIPEAQMAEKTEDVQGRLQGSAGTESVQRLAIDDLSFDHKREGGDVSTLRLTLTPKTWLKDIEGNRYAHVFKAGRFRVKAKLLSSVEAGSGRSRTVLAHIVPTEGDLTVRDGVVTFAMNPHLQYLPTQGQVELALEVTPVRGPRGLGPFEGVFLVGAADVLAGSRNATLRPTYAAGEATAGKDFRLSTYLSGMHDASAVIPGDALGTGTGTVSGAGSSSASAANNAGAATGAALSAQGLVPSHLISAASFELDVLEAKPEQTPVSETALSRTIAFTVSTCIRDPSLNRQGVRDAKFTVVYEDGRRQQVPSDPNGCITWDDKITHDVYAVERYILRHYTVISAKGGSRTRTLVLNPWDDSVFFYFARDLQKLTEEVVTKANAEQREPSRMVLGAFAYEPVRTYYSMDSFLNLKVHRVLNLSLEPLVERHMIRRGRGISEPLRKGAYLLRLAVQRDILEGDKPYQFVSPVKKLVLVENNRVQTPIELVFRFEELNTMTLANRILIELVPIDETKVDLKTVKPLDPNVDLETLVLESRGLGHRTFLGAFVPKDVAYSGRLRATDRLDEVGCVTTDCDQLKNGTSGPKDQDIAKFDGDTKHLAGVTVQQLIKVAEENEKAYQARMRKMAKLSEFVRQHRVDYVALHNAEKILAQDTDLHSLNKVLPAPTAATTLLSRLAFTMPATFPYNQYRNDKFTYETIAGLIEVRDLTPGENARLCLWWVNDFMKKMVTSGHAPFADGYGKVMTEMCVYAGQSTKAKQERPFLIDRKLRTFGVSDYDVKRGDGLVLGIGAGYSVTTGENQSRASTWSFSPTSYLLLLPSKIFTSLVSGLNWSISKTQSEDQGQSQTVVISSDFELNRERVMTQILVDKYERCAVIRMSPVFLDSLKLAGRLNKDLSEEEREDVLNRGLFVCKGGLEAKKILVPENYYYLSALMPENIMLNRNSQRNQSWMMGLRGDADYARFYSMIEARPKAVKDISKNVDLSIAALVQLDRVFQYRIPTYPGVYSVLNGVRLVEGAESARVRAPAPGAALGVGTNGSPQGTSK